MKKKWWKEAVVYQIYPRSFLDSNGDGIGDLKGVIEKLDYLKNLGINVIWMSPIYQSPNDDNGYDISSYYDILDEFGTMNDFEKLLTEVHKRGMGLIMDLVINHTSSEHPWFIESRSSKDNPYRDYYIWHPGKNGKVPNNWESIFEGSAWEFDEKTNEYYMHIFSSKQPDLNWENPAVREDLVKMVNWWLEKGIDGFRVDAISHIKKEEGLPDMPNPNNLTYVPSFDKHMNQPGIDTFLNEFAEKTISNYDIMTVGEANGVEVEDADKWTGEENGYFNMIFQFEHLGLWEKSTNGRLDIQILKEKLTKWQNGLHGIGWNALFIENHDQPRAVSTWTNDNDLRITSAKALATFYFLMEGTPFIYQGQEIGMTNVQFDTIADYKDVAIKNFYNKERKKGKEHKEIMEAIWKNGRDNSRTPMQWSSAANAGFTDGTPWMKTNPNYPDINVEQSLADPNSIYHYYKKLIALRKSSETLLYGKYTLIAADHRFVYAYTRTRNSDKYIVIVNLFNVETNLDLPRVYADRPLYLQVSNYNVSTKHVGKTVPLRPYEARVYSVNDAL